MNLSETMLRRPRSLTVAIVTCALLTWPAAAGADHRFIVRTSATAAGASTLTFVCGLIGCTLRHGLDDDAGRLFVVTTPDVVDPVFFPVLIRSMAGIEDAEPDQVVRTLATDAGSVPPALADTESIDYFGTTVRAGYVRQPAASILGIAKAHAEGVTGRGITVAVIDTGVDPLHPALRRVLLPGRDFTRDRDPGSERHDLGESNQSTMVVLDGAEPARVNQSTMVVLDQSTMVVLDNPELPAFGHGTMVAGVVHLTAPEARILPLKAFRADGTGYGSDVIRAIYHAVRERAKVLNMSFSFAEPSPELSRALEYAAARGVIGVASAGNDGQRVTVYPAGLDNVIGVASTTDYDTLAPFSNFGPEVAWIAAPGEAIVTTYPFGTYAAAWGTSFSAPFAAGTAALLAQLSAQIDTSRAHEAEGHAVWISGEVGRGRLNVPAAVAAWRARLTSSGPVPK
jgi:subtilisin family serine protease